MTDTTATGTPERALTHAGYLRNRDAVPVGEPAAEIPDTADHQILHDGVALREPRERAPTDAVTTHTFAQVAIRMSAELAFRVGRNEEALHPAGPSPAGACPVAPRSVPPAISRERPAAARSEPGTSTPTDLPGKSASRAELHTTVGAVAIGLGGAGAAPPTRRSLNQ